MRIFAIILGSVLLLGSNAFATTCTPATSYVITDAASCPCGYVDAGSSGGTKTCGSYTDTAGSYTWQCI